MKKVIAIIAGLLLVGVSLFFLFREEVDENIYVAVEGEGTIAVIDAARRKVTHAIDLSREHEGGTLPYYPHNVQVAPDGKSVWVTVNAGVHQHAARLAPLALADEGHGAMGEEADEVLVILPQIETVVRRIPIAKGVHLAHVVLTPDSAFAYVTAQSEGAIYKLNAKTYEIVKRITVRPGSEPHGLRIAPDGSVAYVAMLKGRSIGVLDLTTDAFHEVPLEGAAVQAGVTPDGRYAVASLYDTKRLAIYDTNGGTVRYVPLPAEARGPVQMYSTPDSRFVYLADQGYYFSQPASQWVYKIDLAAGEVSKAIRGGQAPHGVVVSKGGQFVYVTNLLGGDVSVIDTSSDTEVTRIPVGKEPNGISMWSRTAGGTP